MLRPIVPFESASTVGLLFEATDLDKREIVLAYAKKLRKKGKKVKLLGYFNNHIDNSNFTFRHFNRKDIDWALRPTGKEVTEFLQHKLDVFINLSTETKSYTEYIAALVNAPLRVGPCTEHTFCYDLMIDLAGKKTLNAFIQQVEQLLKITNTRHETAKI